MAAVAALYIIHGCNIICCLYWMSCKVVGFWQCELCYSRADQSLAVVDAQSAIAALTALT